MSFAAFLQQCAEDSVNARPKCRLCKGTGVWGTRNIDNTYDAEDCPACQPEREF